MVNRKCVVQHSKAGANELTTTMILNETLRFGCNSYKRNWLVSDCKCNVLLVISWNVEFRPTADYVKAIVRLNSVKKSIEASRRTEEFVSSVNLTILSVKTFRHMLTQKFSSNFPSFSGCCKTSNKIKSEKKKQN